MSKLLEILGRAITVDTADLIWHWLDTVKLRQDDSEAARVRRLDNIAQLVANRKPQAAEEQLRLYLFDHPDCVRGRLAAAAISLLKNDLQNAVEQSNSVYMRQPTNTMALYALGHCYERLGRESEAVEFYQDCLKFKNYLHLPRQRLAAIYFKNGQLEKAIQEYELLKDESPDDISTLLTLGHLHITNAQYDRAIESFNTAILIHPDNFHTEDDEIALLIQDGRLYEAIERTEQLLQDQPQRLDLGVRRAEVLSMLGADAEAVEQYRDVLAACPDFLEAAIKLGTQYLTMQEDRLAAKQFNRAVEINDRIVDAYIGLATAQKLAGSPSDALTTLSLAAAIQPNSSLLLAETASLQFRAAFGERAQPDKLKHPNILPAVIEAHKKHLIDRPQNPDLHYRLGILFMAMGTMGEALRALERALQINPTYARARSKLVVCLFEIGQHKLAIERITKADHLHRDTLELHYKTALLYCDKIKFASSLLNLERNLQDNFASPDAAINISIVLQNLGLLDRAVAMWDNLSGTTDQAINANYPSWPGQF
ncbi:MAG: tetratricopeptide repeat protein [Planctomycetota bacterium]|jgi:tetratricopeptide (TPR) repeat protein